MAEHPNRAEIAKIGIVECITETEDLFPLIWSYEQCRRAAERIADALIAAGLVVPAGLTAEKLRDAAEILELDWDPDEPPDLAVELRAWADALGEG